MKILQNNFKNQFSNTTYRITCGSCSSHLEVDENDIQIYNADPNDRFEEYYKFVICPCCGRKVKM